MKVKAMLHSEDKSTGHTHHAPLVEVEIIEKVGDNDYIVLLPNKTKCHAIFNPFTNFYFADDVFGVVR